MTTIRVPGSQDYSYDVTRSSLAQSLSGLSVQDFVVSDANVWRHYADLVPSQAPRMVVPAGEGSKSIAGYRSIIDSMTEAGIRRGGRVIAFGGGVVGDLAGYVAATYMRGIGFIQIPTSLLAMVDSSVGGKVGIDVGGKNNVGAFHHPQQVRICPEFLATLPEDEFRNGMAEVVKYACILSPQLYQGVSGQAVTHTHPGLFDLIESCIRLKQQVVEADPLEKTGQRAILNFGHTFGHALESASGYAIKHGYAVAIGMVMEAHLAAELGIADKELAIQVVDALKMQGLPTEPPGSIDSDQILGFMRLDKKAGGNELTFALVSEIGRCKLVHGVAEKDVKAVMERLWAR